MRTFFLSLLLFALAACSRDSQPQRGREIPQVPAVEVSAVDQFGPAGGAIYDLEFWAHPTLPFNSLVIAAGEAGLVAYNIEDGEEAARETINATFDGVSLAYLGRGPSARGVVAARSLRENMTERVFTFYEIDNVTRRFNTSSAISLSERNGERGFCLARAKEGDALLLYQMYDDGWRASVIKRNDEGTLSSQSETAGEFRGGFNHCVVDGYDGAVFAINAAGEIYRIEDGAVEDAPLAATGVSDPAGIGLALNGLEEGTPDDQCCGQISVLDGVNGVVSLFDREDGHALGAVRMVASFDVEGVTSASAFGVGYGNFGAVYRDGIVALAAEGENGVIRLAPFNGVMAALAQPLGETADPRDLAPQEEEGFVIDVEVVRP